MIRVGSCLALFLLILPQLAESAQNESAPQGSLLDWSAGFQPASNVTPQSLFLLAEGKDSNESAKNGSTDFQPASNVRDVVISIDRAKREMQVIQDGRIIQSCKIGIGRGGLNKKKSMADNITPSGKFEVDLILTSDSKLNRVSTQLLHRYKGDPKASSYLNSGDGLKRLFANMSGLDFDGNGKADTAYGAAYIGLNGISERGKAPAMTGPKLSTYSGKDYWFSIALHGTPNEANNIGKANSGGCVHVPRSVLQKLISDETIRIGSIVEIK